MLSDTLKVEVFRHTLADQVLVGSYSALTNNGALVHAKTTVETQNELSSLLQVPVIVSGVAGFTHHHLQAGTVNRGSELIGAGLCVNDWSAFCGFDTTSTEISVIESIFKLKDALGQTAGLSVNMRDALIDTIS